MSSIHSIMFPKSSLVEPWRSLISFNSDNLSISLWLGNCTGFPGLWIGWGWRGTMVASVPAAVSGPESSTHTPCHWASFILFSEMQGQASGSFHSTSALSLFFLQTVRSRNYSGVHLFVSSMSEILSFISDILSVRTLHRGNALFHQEAGQRSKWRRSLKIRFFHRLFTYDTRAGSKF